VVRDRCHPERVFVDRDVDGLRAQFFGTGAHVLGNSQAQIRLVTKLKFLLGVARKVTQVNGIDRFPQVAEGLSGHRSRRGSPVHARPCGARGLRSRDGCCRVTGWSSGYLVSADALALVAALAPPAGRLA
jgi:hypothetical protein